MVDFRKLLNRTPITSFSGDYYFLSNFCYTPIKQGAFYFPTVEHAYQAAKMTPDTVKGRSYWDSLTDPAVPPGQAKREGRKVRLRPDWESVKVDVMLELLIYKFRPENEQFCKDLRATGDRPLIEGNTWGDRFWGAVHNPTLDTWEGTNKLGELLMDVRGMYR